MADPSSPPTESVPPTPAAEMPFGEGPVADGPEARNLPLIESVALPSGWVSGDIDGDIAVSGVYEQDVFTEIVIRTSINEEARSTRQAARRFIDVHGPNFTDVEYLDPVVVDGRELFHVRASVLSSGVQALGFSQDGYLVFFSFYFNSELLPEGFEEETVAQVMRSVSFAAQG
ncbi:hypothetical protein [uncultured Nocardioides sp.]|uniref:hypothetical protein n=1 Tax=Nocardioides sp. TaxID=35761 RepID=UPI002637BB07|nr:hypothetical protein [uncultured Nocardioides sp.]MCK5927282.1 hypothetical protein [Nocardioides sp.]